MFLLYPTFLACNLLFNYIISNKLFDSYFDFPNMLVVFVNGAMHGFRVFGLYEFKQFTVLCQAVYILWAVFCLYQYVKIKKENTNPPVPISAVLLGRSFTTNVSTTPTRIKNSA